MLAPYGAPLAHRDDLQTAPRVPYPCGRRTRPWCRNGPGRASSSGLCSSDTRCVAASTELAADALEILLQGLVLRIAASLALFACFSEVVLRLAGGAVDGNALWADNFAHVLDDGEVLVAVLSGAVDEVIRILLAFASDSVLEQGTVRDW